MTPAERKHSHPPAMADFTFLSRNFSVLLCLLMGAQASIEIAPQNLAVRVNTNDTLRCKFNVATNQVTGRKWEKDSTLLYDENGKAANTPNETFLSGNDFDLVVEAYVSVAGLYKCFESNSVYKAARISYYRPQNLILTWGVTDLTVKCEVHTGGQATWQASLSLWKGEERAPVSERQAAYRRKEVRYVYPKANITDGDVIACRITFGDASPSFGVNEDDSIPMSDSVEQAFRKPYNLVITKSPSASPVAKDDRLSCASLAFPGPVTYEWLDEGNNIIASDASFTVTTNNQGQNLQCVATNMLGNTTRAIYECTDSSSCANGGSCEADGGSGLHCVCAQGYTGKDCTTRINTGNEETTMTSTARSDTGTGTATSSMSNSTSNVDNGTASNKTVYCDRWDCRDCGELHVINMALLTLSFTFIIQIICV